jgi:hypothetical protein
LENLPIRGQSAKLRWINQPELMRMVALDFDFMRGTLRDRDRVKGGKILIPRQPRHHLILF